MFRYLLSMSSLIFPCFRFPWGSRVRACLAMLSPSTVKVNSATIENIPTTLPETKCFNRCHPVADNVLDKSASSGSSVTQVLFELDCCFGHVRCPPPRDRKDVVKSTSTFTTGDQFYSGVSGEIQCCIGLHQLQVGTGEQRRKRNWLEKRLADAWSN